MIDRETIVACLEVIKWQRMRDGSYSSLDPLVAIKEKLYQMRDMGIGDLSKSEVLALRQANEEGIRYIQRRDHLPETLENARALSVTLRELALQAEKPRERETVTMKIRLDSIKPSPHPVRSSWDEGKMQELAQSIKEQGVIVPIKVRPDNGDYEIVYGHRRVEAARRAGLAEIESVVEGMEDTDALIQALIENVQREDMEPLDTARALKALKESTGWSNNEIDRRGILDQAEVRKYLLLVDLPPDVQQQIALDKGGIGPEERDHPLTPSHVLRVQRVRAGHERAELLRKAAQEHLARDELDQVAKEYVSAEDDAERQAILDTDYHDPAFQQLVKAKAAVTRKVERQERKEREENPREVKEYIQAVQTFSAAIQVAIAVAKFGKFSPEAGRFLAGWHNSIRQGLAELEQEWEG